MKNEHVKAAIANGVECAVHQWFTEQVMQPSKDFYLYARRARSGESIAMPIISQDAPNKDYWVVLRVPKEKSEREVIGICYEALRREPILGTD